MSDTERFPSRWGLAVRWWLIQSLFVFVASSLVAWQVESVSGPSGHALGLRNWHRIWDILQESDYYVTCGTICIGLVILQTLLILPVRKPRPVLSRGVPVMTSLAIAGLAIATLVFGGVLAILAIIRLISGNNSISDDLRWYLVAIACSAWAASTVLLVKWSRGKSHEDVLSRVANRIFKGTIIEAAAVMPIEIMVRRRTECYCSEETLWTLVLCGTVGTFAFGPAMWLPILAKRRRAFHGGHCGFCGYEMSDLAAERCPECGTGWKHSKKSEVGEPASASGVNSVD